ncbi:hypothetical protein SAMN05421678_113188 [Actinopolymorpha cephalotaxi]|uniref:Copper(I)-binding protein n=1 Tax=Actinopolymorpha cephalotaxi TaxID=504797 RepID=A0A1I2Y579_9ACTN|nr:hypothetical protein [Actinopolymorpha cephalotaxi]NYH87309.1 hypothetical protein [Actinopolymorpha cephalotaxi]SFH20096.1 hypothetical protein SAMN05421678_113188 [Actinopolymorpha cephalotaxi]
MLSSRFGRGLAAGLVAIALPVLAGCGSTATQTPYTPSDGVWTNHDNLQLRNVVAVAPREGAATLVGTIFNTGSGADVLTGVRVSGGQAKVGSGTVPLPAGGAAVLGDTTSQGAAVPTTLTGAGVKPGLVIPVTFKFQRAGTVRLDVLVVPRKGIWATVPPPGGPTPKRTPKPIPG